MEGKSHTRPDPRPQGPLANPTGALGLGTYQPNQKLRRLSTLGVGGRMATRRQEHPRPVLEHWFSYDGPHILERQGL